MCIACCVCACVLLCVCVFVCHYKIIASFVNTSNMLITWINLFYYSWNEKYIRAHIDSISMNNVGPLCNNHT